MENLRPSSVELESGSDAVPGVAVGDQNDTAVVGPSGVGLMITEAPADFVGSATLVASTVTVCCVATDAGAVYSPASEIEPIGEESDHVTGLLLLPVMVAVNC